MYRNRIAGIVGACCIAATAFAAEPVETATHRFQEVADGVFLAQTKAPLFNSNSLVVVNAEDVLVVDSHITPRMGRELIASIGEITSKSITTLVNTHFHYDHAHGNQAFGPDVAIIGHEFTRRKMAGDPLAEGTFQRGKLGDERQLASLREQLAATPDGEDRAGIESRIAWTQRRIEATAEISPVAPNITLKERMVLFHGDREIQLHFFGRAHTAGDVSVYLPREKVLYSGDMMFAGISWLGDGYVNEWPETLERAKALDFELVVPGHGPPFSDRGRIDLVQAYYRDLWAGVAALHGQGVDAETAAATVDLTAHGALGVEDVGADPLAVQRIYFLLEETLLKEPLLEEAE